MVIYINSFFTQTNMDFIGVGSTIADKRTTENEDGAHSGSEELAIEPWVDLLNQDEEVYSLKPRKEVQGVNKTDLAKALREYMRQAWGKHQKSICSIIHLIIGF
jgi:hypothetical protein